MNSLTPNEQFNKPFINDVANGSEVKPETGLSETDPCLPKPAQTNQSPSTNGSSFTHITKAIKFLFSSFTKAPGYFLSCLFSALSNNRNPTPVTQETISSPKPSPSSLDTLFENISKDLIRIIDNEPTPTFCYNKGGENVSKKDLLYILNANSTKNNQIKEYRYQILSKIPLSNEDERNKLKEQLNSYKENLINRLKIYNNEIKGTEIEIQPGSPSYIVFHYGLKTIPQNFPIDSEMPPNKLNVKK